MPVLSVADSTALTMQYLDELELLSRAVGAAIREAFMNMSDYERAQLAEWVERARPLSQAGTAEGADLAGAYLAELTGVTPPVIGDLSLDYIDLEAPYTRMWHDLESGMDWNDARNGGASQAEAIGRDSTSGGATKRMGKPGTKVIAYQRVVSAGACEWCQVVATQLYRSAETASLGGQHHSCKCRVVAVTEENAKSVRHINSQRLRSLKKSGAIGRASAARERSRARQSAARTT